MTETAINAVVAEKVLANLADFWEHPEPSRFGGQMPARIAGSMHDQQIPEGTRNPYWEIIRQLPLSQFSLSFGPQRPEPDPYWFGPGETLREFGGRHSLCGAFAWSIISPGDVAWIKDRLNGAGIVEPGAGGGYWAWQLAQAGVDVAAYEPADPDVNSFVVGEPWFPVQRGNHAVTADHPDRSLLLCWPSYDEPWGAAALRAYKGSQLFYAGEGPGGCTGDDEFHDLLEAEWDEVGDCPHHVTYSGIHCNLAEYRRKDKLTKTGTKRRGLRLTRRPAMKLIITEAPGNQFVAEVDGYTGPIPRPGEYIVHPPLYPDRQMGMPNVMGVKTVSYGILARPQNGEDHFVGSAEPYVEIHV